MASNYFRKNSFLKYIQERMINSFCMFDKCFLDNGMTNDCIILFLGLGDVKELLVCFADKIGCEGGGFYWQCKCCHKNNKHKSHLLEHVESTHIPGLQFQCPYCDGVRRTRSSVRSHVNEKHKEEHLMYKRDTVNLDWTMGSENII